MTGTRRMGALLAGLLLAVSGCGARWSEAERAEVFRRAASSGPATGPGASAGDAPGAVAGPGTVGADVTQGAGPVVAVGDVGGTGPVAVSGPGALPCAAPSTAPGVTPEAITIAGINSLSGPVSGLGVSARAATRAYAAYRNATGGVCGRQLVVRDGDDGASGARNRDLVFELEPKVLGFVGGIAGGDSASVSLYEERKVPVIGNTIAPELRRSPTYYGVNMPLARPNDANGKFRFLHAQGVRRAAVVYSAPAVSEGKAQIPSMEAAGIDVVLDLALPLATLSYDSAARAVANSKADYLLFVHEQGASASMARALSDARYSVRFPEYIVAYGSSFVELAGAAAEGATTWLYTLPSEDQGQNAELDRFLEWMDRTAPGTAKDTFASVAWAAAKAFVQVVEGLPGPISRPAMFAEAASLPTYDADGMIARVRFNARVSEGCLVGVVVRGGRWERLAPASGFLC